MILSAFIFKLKAVANASLPVSHGRLLHAALLDFIQKHDYDLSVELHDSNVKKFSIDMLNFAGITPNRGCFSFQEGMTVYWRVNSLDDRLNELLMNITEPVEMRIGRANFIVECVRYSRDAYGRAEMISMQEILDESDRYALCKTLSLTFMTPTTFRVYNIDYPFPKLDLVFGSLAERWNDCSDGVVFDVENVKQIASQFLSPINWNGETRRVNLTPQNGVTGFTGRFVFTLQQLPPEYRRIFFALAKFAEFSGVGRLTGQGFGRVRISVE